MDAKDAGDEKERQRCHCQLYVIFSGSLKFGKLLHAEILKYLCEQRKFAVGGFLLRLTGSW